MSKTPEKNGAKAVVESWQAATGRWLVRDVETGETFLVKQDNLKLERRSTIGEDSGHDYRWTGFHQ